MKTFYCEKCGSVIGEMVKGKLKKGTVLICKKCHDNIKLKEDANRLRNITNPLPNDFVDIFSKFRK